MFIGFRKLLAVVAIFIMLILKMRKETRGELLECSTELVSEVVGIGI